MKTYSARSPTRVDLAGGTLDLWPLNCFIEDCLTINVAINIFTECQLTIRDDNQINLKSVDQKFSLQYKNWEEFKTSTDPKAHFYRVHARFWRPSWGFDLVTNSQSPLGGGLGGSSSLSVSVMKAFSQATGRKFSLHEMVNIGHNLEAAILRTPTGVQDYVPAIQGGINFIKFSPNGFEVTRAQIPVQFYNDHALLVYTGRPHHSGLNNFEVLKNAVIGNETTFRALQGIRDAAVELRECLEKNQTNNLKKIFDKEYDCRIQLTEAFTSPEIERLRQIALQAGADSIKICGAGGGGCVMVWCQPTAKAKVKEFILRDGFNVLETSGVDV